MLVPLYGFLAGDTMGLIVLVHAEQSVADIAAALQEAAAPRVAPSGTLAVFWRGQRLDPTARIGELGIEPLDRVDVGPEVTP